MDLDVLLFDTAVVPDPSLAVLADGRAALDGAVGRSEPQAGVAQRSIPGRRRRVTVAAVVIMAACLSLVVGPTVSVGRKPAAQADATQVLLQAGAAAGAQEGGWPDAAYWHSVSTRTYGSHTYRRESWVGHRTSGIVKDDAFPSMMRLGVAQFPAGARTITWDELYALPSDPRALEKTLRGRIDGVGENDASELFIIVGDILRESPAPPALRKALWEVAADIPGVALVGPVTDGAGRPGVAVERDYQRYVLDPASGQLLEESAGGAPSGLDSARTGYRVVYLEQGPADDAPGLAEQKSERH